MHARVTMANVLVGHSYGGVADRVPERVAHLAYVDGFVLRDGQSVFDLNPPEVAAWLEEEARTGGDGWRVPPFAAPELADFSRGRDDPHPLATLREPLRLGDPDARAIPRTYIHCTGKAADDPLRPVFEPFAARARSESGWRTVPLVTPDTDARTGCGRPSSRLRAPGRGSRRAAAARRAGR